MVTRPVSPASAASSHPRARTPSWSNGIRSSAWSSSTRSPGGRPRTSGPTSSCTRFPTTRFTTRTVRASAAPTAPARCGPARIRGPDAGPGSPRPSAGCTSNSAMDSHLRQLEDQSVYILREAYKHFDHLAMLWSMGKDSTVLLWLTRKAFFGHVPFPLVHIDTSYKIPAMIEYRDRIAREWRLNLVIGQNKEALANGMNHPRGPPDCCTALTTNGLKHLIAQHGYTGTILRVRPDQEGTRAKDRYFSPRDKHGDWDFREQPPELWDQFKTAC